MEHTKLEQQLANARIELDSDVEEDFETDVEDSAKEVEEDVEEEWRDVVGFPGYHVSNYGSVFDKDAKRILTANPCKRDGYCYVGLRRDGRRRRTRPVHQLVAEAFVENINPGVYTQVDHVNRIRSDNRARNVRWVDAFGNQYNRADRFHNTADRPGPESVQVRQYGRHIFDRLYYDGRGIFFMYIDEHMGFREIVPKSQGNSYVIRCMDVSGVRRNMGLVKLTNYAIILLTEKYDEIARRRWEAENITGISPEDESD